MENFFHDDEFYSDLDDFMERLEIDEETIESFPDFFKCYESTLEPIIKLDADWIIERIDSDRLSDEFKEQDKIEKALSSIDFQKVNQLIPKLYYGNGRKFEITKADLYEHLK